MTPSLADWLTMVSMVGAGTVVVLGAVWSLAWWLAKQFSIVFDKIQHTLDVMVAKLEYHEKHDDERFAAISRDIWEIRLRNASSDHQKLKDKEDSK